jgi:hypothetical protein
MGYKLAAGHLIAGDIDGGMPVGFYPLAAGDLHRGCAFAPTLGPGLEVGNTRVLCLTAGQGDGERVVGGCGHRFTLLRT